MGLFAFGQQGSELYALGNYETRVKRPWIGN